jgi:AraC-like DNA-binding protein
MQSSAAPMRLVKHASELGEWEMVYRAPAPPLRPYVYPYCGYTERSLAFQQRRQVPGVFVPLIINLGPPLEVSEAGQPSRFHTFNGPFVAGLHQAHSVVQSVGEQQGIQVNLSPIGARLLFHLPMDHLSNHVLDLDDVLGPGSRRLVEALRDTPAWESRFDLLDSAILQRFAAADPPSDAMTWTWRQLVTTGGNADIATLAGDLGWTPGRLIAECREHLGLPPKLLARIIRFSRAREMLEREGGARYWADIAFECGYYDQAHFSRDFREFAGTSPTIYLQQRTPDREGVSAASGL